MADLQKEKNDLHVLNQQIQVLEKEIENTSDIMQRTRKEEQLEQLQQKKHDIENDIIPVARELGVGIVAYSPLGRGIILFC